MVKKHDLYNINANSSRVDSGFTGVPNNVASECIYESNKFISY